MDDATGSWHTILGMTSAAILTCHPSKRVYEKKVVIKQSWLDFEWESKGMPHNLLRLDTRNRNEYHSHCDSNSVSVHWCEHLTQTLPYFDIMYDRQVHPVISVNFDRMRHIIWSMPVVIRCVNGMHLVKSGMAVLKMVKKQVCRSHAHMCTSGTWFMGFSVSGLYEDVNYQGTAANVITTKQYGCCLSSVHDWNFLTWILNYVSIVSTVPVELIQEFPLSSCGSGMCILHSLTVYLGPPDAT